MNSIVMQILLALAPSLEKALLEALKAAAEKTSTPIDDAMVVAFAEALGIKL